MQAVPLVERLFNELQVTQERERLAQQVRESYGSYSSRRAFTLPFSFSLGGVSEIASAFVSFSLWGLGGVMYVGRSRTTSRAEMSTCRRSSSCSR